MNRIYDVALRRLLSSASTQMTHWQDTTHVENVTHRHTREVDRIIGHPKKMKVKMEWSCVKSSRGAHGSCNRVQMPDDPPKKKHKVTTAPHLKNEQKPHALQRSALERQKTKPFLHWLLNWLVQKSFVFLGQRSHRLA